MIKKWYIFTNFHNTWQPPHANRGDFTTMIEIAPKEATLAFLTFLREKVNECRLPQNKVYLHRLVWIEIFPWVDNFLFLWRLVHRQLFLRSGLSRNILSKNTQKIYICRYLGLKVFSSCECVPRMRFSWTKRFILQTRQPSMCLREVRFLQSHVEWKHC